MTSKSKTLAGLGMRTLDEYVDSLPAHAEKSEVWVNINDDSCINVSHIGSKYAYYSEDGSSDSHSMDIKNFTENYRLAGLGKELAPAADDTFNDDTPAQTFGDIQWDEGTDEKSVKVAVCLTRVPNLWRRDDKKVRAATDEITLQEFMDVMVDKMCLIGIAGPARAGKDTLASYLLDNLSDDWSRSSFADPIKEMLRAIGVDCSDDAKAVVNDDYGVTPRHMMQTLGTEWGRQTIDNDIWVKAFARLNACECVIVPDVRFENEAALVREHGVLIHLVGRGGIEGSHVSENAIEFKPGDIVIDNSRDLAWLHGQVDGNAILGEFIAEVSE